MQRYGFILGILITILLAAVFPKGGAGPGYLLPDVVSKGGVCLIFFFQGLALKPNEIKRGALNWKLHLWIQSFIFVLAPVLAWMIVSVFGTEWDPALRVGFLYLGFLPTTITSAVAFVISAQGNVPAAIFNTSLSNVAGVFLTPLLTASAMGAVGSGSPPVGPLLLKISMILILPLLMGQIIRPWLAVAAVRYRPQIKKLTTGIVFFILYTAFCDSVLNETWSLLNVGDMTSVLVLTLMYMGLLTGIIWFVSLQNQLGFSEQDRSVAVFCGSQKTLAAGAPMAAFIFTAQPEVNLSLSLALLPLVIYHPCQLILAAMLLPKFRTRPPATSDEHSD